MTKEVVRGFSYDQTTSFRDRREHTRCDEMIKRVLKLALGNVCKHFSNVGEQGANSIGCSSPRLNRRDPASSRLERPPDFIRVASTRSELLFRSDDSKPGSRPVTQQSPPIYNFTPSTGAPRRPPLDCVPGPVKLLERS